MRTVHQPIK